MNFVLAIIFGRARLRAPIPILGDSLAHEMEHGSTLLTDIVRKRSFRRNAFFAFHPGKVTRCDGNRNKKEAEYQSNQRNRKLELFPQGFSVRKSTILLSPAVSPRLNYGGETDWLDFGRSLHRWQVTKNTAVRFIYPKMEDNIFSAFVALTPSCVFFLLQETKTRKTVQIEDLVTPSEVGYRVKNRFSVKRPTNRPTYREQTRCAPMP